VTARTVPVLVWIAFVVAAAFFVSRLRIDTDMAAFLPRTATPGQQILVEQLRDGVVSHLVLIAIEGAPADQSARISKQLAARLRTDPAFVAVENGEESGFGRDRDFLWSNRYLLSDQVTPGRFTRTGLRAALEHDVAALGSTEGFLVEHTLAADPTGEMLHLIEQQMGNGDGPARRSGVFMSPDGRRALLLVRLRAAGSDIDGAEHALATIRAGFAEAAGGEQSQAVRLLMTGPPVFAVESRDRIRSDATRLSTIAAVLVATALLVVYRSPRVLVLAFIPVVTGALAGVAMVGLAFKSVQGVTLGFGATLIGEAVDYAVYLFTQTTPDSPIQQTLARIWPTLRLGVLTSICGFSAMLLSGFEGFAQLGLFTITGLAVAVGVTRFVLPALLPVGFAGVRQSRTMMRAATIAAGARRLRAGVAVVVVAASASLATGQGAFWAGDILSLSPVPPAEQHLDQSLRRDMRAPDATDLVVIRQPDQEAALKAAERVAGSLLPVVRQGGLGGFDAPTRYLPSLTTQRARQAALPDPGSLHAAFDAALSGLPFQPGLFAPFFTAVEKARLGAPVQRADLHGTSLSLKLDSLLLEQPQGWVVILSLRGVRAPQIVRAAIAAEPGALLVNLKAESNNLLRAYLREGASLAALGAAAIAVLLLGSLRSLRRLASVIAPLGAAVVVTLAVLRLGGHALSVFNLFGVLLVVAIGSNYCLFFDRYRHDPAGLPRVLASLLLANGCTVAGFGVLALSRTPVLHDLGLPVAIGTFLSLVFATIMMWPRSVPEPCDAGEH
jgi:predicted exporter